MKINNHGDLILYPITKQKPPKDAESSKTHVLEQSSTTGNRHEVVSKDKPIYRWFKDKVEYLHCDNDYEIRHLGGDEEHGAQPVEKGTCEVRHEEEYDPWKNELKRIID